MDTGLVVQVWWYALSQRCCRCDRGIDRGWMCGTGLRMVLMFIDTRCDAMRCDAIGSLQCDVNMRHSCLPRNVARMASQRRTIILRLRHQHHPLRSNHSFTTRLASFSTELFDAIIIPRSLRVYLPLFPTLTGWWREKDRHLWLDDFTHHILLHTSLRIYISSWYERIAFSSLDSHGRYEPND